MKIFLFTILITAAAAVGWFARPHFSGAGTVHENSTVAERKILFYQSAMHPWIKSDKPGRCTICGMQLTPVYEGEKGLDVADTLFGSVIATSPSELRVPLLSIFSSSTLPLPIAIFAFHPISFRVHGLTSLLLCRP